MLPAIILRLGTVAFFTAAASTAGATTLNLGSSGSNTGGASYWTATTNFTLPAGFTSADLNITDLECDDRCVLELNGTIIDNAGIFGPGAGSFVFTANGTNDPFTFNANGARNIDVTSGFLVGSNVLLLILNDTGTGISGSLTNGPNGPAGPTGFGRAATLTFNAPTGVPEPASWIMMLLGFGGIAASLRFRRARSLVTS